MTIMEKYLDLIKESFPQHHAASLGLLNTFTAYFETSALNYVLGNIPQEQILNTRAYLKSVNKNWLTSPVAIWEILLTSDDLETEKLIFTAQNLFYPTLLASPSELVVRYLKYAYPENKINYPVFSNSSLNDIWKNMAKDTRITFVYDKDALKQKTSLLRKFSKNLPSIIDGKATSDNLVDGFGTVIQAFYDLLISNGIKLPADKIVCKFVMLYSILLLVVLADFEKDEINEFWAGRGLKDGSTYDWLKHILESYPDLFWRGPVLEMANMACYQYKKNRRDRGILLDGMHMVYAPYCDVIFTNDDVFASYKNENPFYKNQIFHMSETKALTVPYTSQE